MPYTCPSILMLSVQRKTSRLIYLFYLTNECFIISQVKSFITIRKKHRSHSRNGNNKNYNASCNKVSDSNKFLRKKMLSVLSSFSENMLPLINMWMSHFLKNYVTYRSWYCIIQKASIYKDIKNLVKPPKRYQGCL